MKKTKIIFLGCGSSTGVPRIDGFWGNCNKQNRKNIRTRCSLFIAKGKNKIVVDASPDIKSQFLRGNVIELIEKYLNLVVLIILDFSNTLLSIQKV